MMSNWDLNPDYPRPKSGEPPLHRAAREGDDAAIRSLAEAGADLDEVFDMGLDPSGRCRPATPLMVAAGSGEGATLATVASLLELGADPRRSIDGRSAATFACEGIGWNYPQGGDAPRLRLLLDKGSPLPEDPEAAQLLLARTAGKGDVARLAVLLECGLSPDAYWDPEAALIADDDGDPGSDDDLPEDLRSEMDELMDSFDAEMEEQEASAPFSFKIPLFQAVESGSEACVRLLLDAGADLSVRDNSKQTAMYSAASEEMVRLLLEAGLPIEDSDVYGWSPLVNAVSDGEAAIPRMRGLIAAGADVNGTHDRGYTVFMSAVGSGRDPNVLRLLIESGADPHAVSELGYNAFHAAIDVDFGANAEESVRNTLGYLKELDVDIEHRNRAGQTPLARAIERGTSTEVQVLCELGADVEAVIRMRMCGKEACEENDLPLIFHVVMGAGVDPHEKAESLLRAGANVLANDADGYTPLSQLLSRFCDTKANYLAFYEGFPDFTVEPVEREGYVAEILPTVRAYVEEFARQIPPDENPSEYAEEWRQEKIACISILAAYETWMDARRDVIS